MTLKWQHLVFGCATLGGALAILGGRLDGPFGDQLSRIAVPLILLPLAAIVAAVIRARFLDFIEPIEDGLRSIEGGNGRYTRLFACALAVLLAFLGSYIYFAVLAQHEAAGKRDVCVRRLMVMSPPCTSENEAVCRTILESVIARRCG